MELICSSSRGLLEVIDDILEFSKLEVGEISFFNEPFNLQYVADQVLDLAMVAAGQKALQVSVKVGDDVPLHLIGDSSRLRQVLLNLVANAIKFTNEGFIKIRFSLVSQSDLTANIRCEVIDSGIGIDAGAADLLFLPFSQADQSSSRRHGGSGLGLSISKQIIEANSGTIGVKSNPDKGSTFWFEQPFTIANGEIEAPKDEPQAPAANIIGTKVLLAEDDRVNQFVATKQLQALGLSADLATNGHEVLKALEQESYPLILMDCQMPEMDGLEATRIIRDKGYSATDLPIIALTAHAFEEDRERCLQAGMNDFLSKPVLLQDLRDTVIKWLDKDR
jgi:CheY-like chemotaxis protein